MSDQPTFDLAAAHRWFSADCFNRVWGYLEKADRSDTDNEVMLSLAHVSLAHWRDREDATDQNFSIGYWLLSRVYAVRENATPALHYGQLCLEYATKESPFFRAYGHEAIARAEKVAGNREAAQAHLEQIRALLDEVTDSSERSLLETDLADLSS